MSARHVKELQWVLTTGEADMLLKLVYAGHEKGMSDGGTQARRYFLALRRMGLAEENPSCPGHWRVTDAGERYYR